MNKPKQNPKNNKKSLLIDGLYDFLKNNDHDQLQLKPQQYPDFQQQQDKFSLLNRDGDLEEYKKDYSSRIDKQLLIISQNIAQSLFGLNNEKFTAFMSRYNVWGFDLTMQQFIINFYLVVKTDNLLRQFVMDHMDKIIKTTRNVVQKYLITHMADFRFRELRTEYNRKKLKDQMKQNQQQIDKRLTDRDKQPVQQDFNAPGPGETEGTAPISPIEQNEQGEVGEVDTTPIGEAGGITNPINPFTPPTTPENAAQTSIISMTDMMNMTDAERANIGTNNGEIPQIQDNMAGITGGNAEGEELNNPPPIPGLASPNNNKEQETQPQTDDQKNGTIDSC